jgi:hypothetical protein
MVKLCALFWLMLLPEIDIAFLLVLMAASATSLLSLLHYHPQEDSAVF